MCEEEDADDCNISASLLRGNMVLLLVVMCDVCDNV